MGRTYAKFLFSTADFQVKFYAGRFCAKIFLISLQSHWLSRISYANSALSITANIIWFPAKRVTFAVTAHVDNHGSGKSSAAFLGFHTFFRCSDSNAADVCFVVPLRTALRAITCDKHCINSRIQTTETKLAPAPILLDSTPSKWILVWDSLLRSYNSRWFL